MRIVSEITCVLLFLGHIEVLDSLKFVARSCVAPKLRGQRLGHVWSVRDDNKHVRASQYSMT